MSKEGPILVVEDDNDARQLLCVMLQTLGHETMDFDSGKATLENIGETKPSMAMLDIMMPEMDGYELLERLKQLPIFENVPVVMVTAKDQDDDVMEGYKHGADYYITKPYTMNQLKYALDLYLAKG